MVFQEKVLPRQELHRASSNRESGASALSLRDLGIAHFVGDANSASPLGSLAFLSTPAHGRSYHIGCAAIPRDTVLEALPGWAELPAERRQQALANWRDLNEPLLTAKRQRTNDATMETNTQQNMDTNETAAEPNVEDWLDPDDTYQDPGASLLEMNLKNMEFWLDLSYCWNSLRQRWASIGNIPTEIRYAVMQLRSAISEVAASGPKVDEKRIAAQKCFFFLDRILFHRNAQRRGGKRGQKGVSNAAAVASRVRMAWEGRWSELWMSSCAAVLLAGELDRKTGAELLAADVRTNQDAFAEGGQKSAARMVDERVEMAPESKAARVLPGLFPTASKPLPSFNAEALKSARKPADMTSFQRHLTRAFRFAPTRRGAGWGGSKSEFWHWAPDFEHEWQHLSVFLTQLALAWDIHAPTLDAFMSCRILAQDRREIDKVRPLGLGTFFRRCVNSAKNRTFKARVSKATAPYQYAAGGTQTAETMHKTALVNLDSRPNAGIHKFDVSNAHQEYERKDAAVAVEQLLPELLPWIAGELATETTHYYVGPSGSPLRLAKNRGGDQGDPCTGMAFMLTYHGVISKCQAAARTIDSEANAYAYQDDLDMVALPGAAGHASDTYISECAGVGLRANAGKETWTPGRDVPVDSHPGGIRIAARATVLKHGGGGDFEVPVTVAATQAHDSQLSDGSPELVKLEAERGRVIKRIRQLHIEGGLSAQLALNLLRLKTCGDATFLARACGIPSAVAERLDCAVASLVIELSGIPAASWDATAHQRIFLPMSVGGLGFASIQLAAAGALAASWQANLEKIRERLQAESVADLFAASPWLMQVRRASGPALRLLHDQHGVDLGDSQLPQFRQSDVTKARAEQFMTRLFQEPGSSQQDQTAVRSAGGKGAGAWLCAPREPVHHFNDAQLRASLATRLNLDIPAHSGTCKHRRPDGSFCGAHLDAKGRHARACLTQGWRVYKHDSIVGGLADWCLEMGCAVDTEAVIPTASANTSEGRLGSCSRSRSASVCGRHRRRCYLHGGAGLECGQSRWCCGSSD